MKLAGTVTALLLLPVLLRTSLPVPAAADGAPGGRDPLSFSLTGIPGLTVEPSARRVSLQGVAGEIALPASFPVAPAASLPFTCREVSLAVGPFPSFPFRLEALRCAFTVGAAVTAPFRPAVEIASFTVDRFAVTLRRGWEGFKPQDLSGRLRRCLGGLAAAGHCPAEASFAGTVDFLVDGTPLAVRWRSLDGDGGTRLEIDDGDVASVAAALRLSQPLTEAETLLLSRYPLEAPRLLVLRDRASRTSRRARQKDSAVPEDAYRHILWSYLLARKYGPDFAREVTDAHEKGKTGNTEAQRRMDYHNNRVGERYAAEGVAEAAILKLVKTDPQVVRRPEDAP